VPASHLTADVYGKDFAPCERCRCSLSADFPLAPKPLILEILGYV
jgi:hypothetical protein